MTAQDWRAKLTTLASLFVPWTAPYAFRCPDCGAVLALASARQFQSQQGDWWLYDSLSMEDWEAALLGQADDPAGAYLEVNFGLCRPCGVRHVVVGAWLADFHLTEEVIIPWWESGVPGLVGHQVTGVRGQTWLITRYDTPLGRLEEHLLGPFPSVTASWVHLQNLWPEVKAAFGQAWPETGPELSLPEYRPRDVLRPDFPDEVEIPF